MKIIVFSDSHSDIRRMKEALNLNKANTDAVVFLGDGLKDIYYLKTMYPNIAFFEVKGNCDFFEKNAMVERVICLDGVKVLITHGHEQNVKAGYVGVAMRAERLGADAVFFGHTHTPFDDIWDINGKCIHLFNPGSIGKNGDFGVVNISGNVLVTNHGKIL